MAALCGRQLRDHLSCDQSDLRAGASGCGWDAAGCGDCNQLRRADCCVERGYGNGSGGSGRADEYVAAGDQRHGAGGPDADGVAGVLVGDGADHVRLPMAPLLGGQLL